METERPTIVKTLNANPPRINHHDVMEKTTTTTANSLRYNRSLFPQNNNHHLPLALSSYQIRPELPKTTSCGEDIVDDSDQISVFQAENYFNETDHDQSNDDQKIKEKRRISLSSGGGSAVVVAPNHDHQRHPVRDNHHLQRSEFSSRLSSVSSSVVDDTNGRAHGAHSSFHATPTASSEASWNSQTGLLSNPAGSIAVSMRNLANIPHAQKKKIILQGSSSSTSSSSASTPKWCLRTNIRCPCAGKKSVQVEEKTPQSKSSPRSDQYLVKSHKSSQHHLRKLNLWDQSKTTTIKPEQIIKPITQRDVGVERRRFSAQNHFVSDIIAPPPPHHHHHHRDGTGFSFPILNQPSKLLLKGIPTATSNQLEDLPRESLEIFQPPEESISGRDRPSLGFPASPMSRITATTEADDAASDASSDLFEIESFSTHQMYRLRDSLDEATTFNTRRLVANVAYGRRRSLDESEIVSVAAAETECYEPSEASIAWSVTTAEGFDRASVANFSVSASDIDDVTITRRGDRGAGGGDGSSNRRAGTGNGLLMLSCRCEKAVSVEPTAAVVGSGRHVSVVNKAPLGRSRSGRLSLAFAT
ncbi:phytochrome kinase substrate 4 [Actinidia rufa]|uniref:Phytochrome kinase substrate 4 n=1 Tax=Actinidia rufa TaxID=165716 RepID=A0A7J0E3X9_9ERIC|nr:phytochrome kinase substrate 4 [Actinidia rufa]